MTQPIVSVESLTVAYKSQLRTKSRPAVNGIDLSIWPAEFVGVVGESGSGKTTLAYALAGLVAPQKGSIRVGNADPHRSTRGQLRAVRRRVQILFQDPYDSLNPRMTVKEIIEEPLRVHHLAADRRARRELADSMLMRVGLTPPHAFKDRRPHQLSGGQRQRVGLAAALVLQPEVLIADEPVSMLDMSVRIGILKLLRSIRDELGTTIVMITHDLPTATIFCDRIIVMFEGQKIEEGTPSQLLAKPKSEYTMALLSAAEMGKQKGKRSPAVDAATS